MLKKVIEIDSVIENISALNRNYLASLWTGSEIYKSNGIVCTCKNHSHVFFYVHIKMSRAYPYERIFRQNTYVNALAWTCLKLYIQSTSSTVYTLCICTAFSLALNIFYSKFKTFLDVTILWGAGVGLFSQKKSNFSNLLKVHIFWEGHQIFQNLHLTFDEPCIE